MTVVLRLEIYPLGGGIDYTKSEKRLNTQIGLDRMYDSGKLSERDTGGKMVVR